MFITSMNYSLSYKIMRIFSISCIFIFLTFQSSAQPLPSEPRYRLAYLESLLEEVQDLPEEERFLYLSYTSMVRNDYRRVVEDMIVTKGVLERMKTEGITQTNKAYQRRVEKLKHYKQSLRKKTTRLLSYQELEIKISRQAIEEMVSNPVEKSIQRDYYEALTFWIRFKELKKMPEEELFLYLRDNSGVDRSYHLLIEDREKYKKDLDELQALGVDEKDER